MRSRVPQCPREDRRGEAGEGCIHVPLLHCPQQDVDRPERDSSFHEDRVARCDSPLRGLHRQPEKRKDIAEEVSQEMNKLPSDDVAYLMAALIFMGEGDIENALRVFHMSESLECIAGSIQCLLKLDRADLATKELRKMQEIDEDATLSQLALAWCNMYVGKDKLNDAFYIYQEMMDKYGANPTLLVSQASCLIQQEKYAEAEKLLMDAQQRDAHNAEVLVNLVACSQFLGKPTEVTNRYMKQLITEFPHHSWSIDYAAKEKLFERVVLETSA
ncbi:hypothetical protein L596_018699 [Steinernema carpocapsae]|uniref:Coatomer subunit epsilon n=1 Tax=Steinernema carpocapsae TaxID=34508 RepID=A0A4U5N5E8_STECR|nr:hypothetical protein L596_018699 [Steinernema carpocapsae]